MFEYPYDEIARLLTTSVTNARQLVRRAGVRAASGAPRFPVSPSAHRGLLRAFLAASREGDTAPLEAMLAGAVAG